MKSSLHHISILILLTGYIAVSLLSINAAETQTNATRTDSDESNKTVKRSFDFPTIFYPGPDNRFITLAPLPVLPPNLLNGGDSGDVRREFEITKTFHQHQLVDDSKPFNSPTRPNQPNLDIQVNRINAAEESLGKFPSPTFGQRPPQRFFDGQQQTAIKPPQTAPTTTIAPELFVPIRDRQQPTPAKLKTKNVSSQRDRFHPPPTTFRPAQPFVQQFPSVDNQIKITLKDSRTTQSRPTFATSRQPQLSLEKPHDVTSTQQQHRRINDIDNNSDSLQSSFVCRPKMNGYFADVESGCQMFHICNNHRRFSFRCPHGTRFSQSLLVCDWHYRVKCSPDPL